ncbi:unnamed protein product [Cyclocybe aegerita]|uniref:Methyltransferase domain-containing protein n=1 Tax=Cyclocybe aegerita TaxID=1973307 RepID=A0A8S0X7T9_CYCAE|nr:unnamed protein product [Cyclocybe aegerita]
MRSIFHRHPRTVLLLIAALISTYLFFPFTIGTFQAPNYTAYVLRDDGLPSRIAHAEEEYANVVRSRREMIRKYGPETRDIELFPPDKSPWPPYTVWSFFPAAFDCPHEVLRLGTLADGGKWVCGLSRLLSASPSPPSSNTDNSHSDDADDDKPISMSAASLRPCVIYSIGLGYDSSFEADLLGRAPHCRVWGYDNEPRVKGWGWSGEVGRGVKARASFKPWSLVGKEGDGGEDEGKYTLERLMEINGHTHIDILKIDLESREFDTMRTLLRPYIASGKPLPFGQLLLEIHVWDRGFPELLAWWEMLEAVGLRPFWTQPNLVYQNYNKKKTAELAEYSFLNVQGENIFISDPLSSSRLSKDVR